MKPLDNHKGLQNWIKQPNRVTFSRYKSSEIQENLLTLLAHKLQEHLTDNLDFKTNLFTEPLVEISLNQLGERGNHKYFYEEAVKMRAIGIDYYFKNEKEHLIQKNLGIIVSVSRNYNIQTLTITLNKEAIPFLIYTGLSHVGKYTNYSLNVALTLRGVYTKRIYKLLSSWKNKGGFTIAIDTLKRLLFIETKYKNIAHLRKLLDTTKEKLQKEADLFFEYELKKENGFGKYNVIVFKIIPKTLETLQSDNTVKLTNDYNNVRSLLNIWFPVIESSFTMDISDKLLANGNLKVAIKRLKNMEKQYSGKIKSKQDCINNIRRNCLKDWDCY